MKNNYVTIKFRDSLGNESGKYADAIVYDNTPPTGSITINEGTLYTNNRTVTLNLVSTDTGVDSDNSDNSEMKISNLSNLSDAVSWNAFDAESSWDLEDSDGEKTVYVIFRDSLENAMSTADKYSASNNT